MDTPAMSTKPFNLSRRFALIGLVSIATLSAVCALLMSRFLTERMLHQEAVLTMEFIRSVVLVENAGRYFREGQVGAQEVNSAFNHVANMPDVIRAITEKLLRRHPHVFGTAEAETAEAVAGQLL